MRKMFRLGSAAVVSFSFAILTGCKDKDATTDESVTPADTAMTIEPDTTSTLNDSNTSGVTSGTM